MRKPGRGYPLHGLKPYPVFDKTQHSKDGFPRQGKLIGHARHISEAEKVAGGDVQWHADPSKAGAHHWTRVS